MPVLKLQIKLMRAHRLVYRADFPRNYELMNQPGTVARMLVENFPKDFFDAYGEERNTRRSIAKKLSREKGTYKAITVEPTAVVCEIESVGGTEMQRIAEGEFKTLSATIGDIFKTFKIFNLERSGLRLYIFGQAPNGSSLQRVLKLINPALIKSTESCLGGITDAGLALDGTSEEKVSYHLKFGPYLGAQEHPKYFAAVNDIFSKSLDANFVIDLDMFESKFADTTGRPMKWCGHQLNVARRAVDFVVDSLK
jgi:hypothetical protein